MQAVHYSEPTAVYECWYDIGAHVKLSKYLGKRDWKTNFLTALSGAIQWCVYFVPLSYFVAWFASEEGIAAAMLVSLGIGLLAGTLMFYTQRDTFNKHGDRRFWNSKWTCWFTDEAYWMRDDDGFVTGIPWSKMRIDLELPEAWTFKDGEFALLVFRQPLQEAGLEDEFRRRVETNSEGANTTESAVTD